MITRHLRSLAGIVSVVPLALIAVSCEKSPLLAPTGSNITLTSATTALPANGSAVIIAQVLEQAGTPPHSGTQVIFTTTLGSIDPAQASTDASGRATVTFHANGSSGIAIIQASSGGASTSTSGGSSSSGGTGGTGGTGTTTTGDRSLRIAVGVAAVGRVTTTGNPTVLPVSGGVSTIVANVLDVNGNPLSAATVTFSTTAGSLSSTTATTDGSGNATVTLTTSQNATVTATVGVGGSSGTGSNTQTSTNTSSVTITLRDAPTILITLPSTPPSAGLPSSYTFTVTAANGGSGGTTPSPTPSPSPSPSPSTLSPTATAIRDVTVNWGDGSNQSLGSFTGAQAVAHTYQAAQTYTISAAVTDVSGEVGRVSTAVSVIPVPQLAVQVTPSPPTVIVNGLITFNILVTVPNGITVQNTAIDFGDGEVRQLGGATSASVTKSYSTPGVRTVTVAVLDTLGRTTIGTAVVSVTP